MTVGSFYLPWEGLLGGLVVILLLGNMIVCCGEVLQKSCLRWRIRCFAVRPSWPDV